MRDFICFSLCLAISLAAFALRAGAQLPSLVSDDAPKEFGREEPNRQLTGRVLPAPGESQLPSEVFVTLRGLFYQEKVVVRDGTFRFFNVPPGSYTLTASARGYRDSHLELDELSLLGEVTISLGPRLPTGSTGRMLEQKSISLQALRAPEKARRELEKGMQELKRDRLEKALGHFKKALQIYPQFPQAYNNMGVVYLGSGRLAEAEAAFSKAMELAPERAPAQKNMGRVYLATNRAAEAVELLSKVAASNRSDPEAHILLGRALYQATRYREAEGPLRRALELDSNYHHASYWLGFVYLAMGRYGEALENLRRFLRTNRGSDDSQVRHLVSSLEKIVR